MKVSYNWLKWYVPNLPPANELEEIFTFKICEVEEVIPFSKTNEDGTTENDFIFDLKILPDRAGDLLSHLGVARELSGVLKIPFVSPVSSYKIPESIPTNLVISINTDKCARYMGRIVRNFKVGPSPDWVVKHLESIGERSINNIVDATNLVMYNTGNPTHAFDLKKLTSEKIFITEAQNEFDFPVVGRDEFIAKIKPGDIVINDETNTLALAGIKGGTNSGINIDAPYTTDLLIEVANFDAARIRTTGQRLSLYSDARKRFENNISPEFVDYTMTELSSLILEMCPDAVFENIVDGYKNKDQKRTIEFKVQDINKVLGTSFNQNKISDLLLGYNYELQNQDDNFVFNIPFYRHDINTVCDVADEIGRIYGYENLEAINPNFVNLNTDDEIFSKINSVREYFISMGYSEIYNYSFVKKGEVQVARGLKGKDYLRSNLIDGLKESYEFNRLNLPLLNKNEIKIFEIGTVFTNNSVSEKNLNDIKEEIHVAYIDKKNTTEESLDEFYTKNQENILNLGKVKYGELVSNFKPWSSFPFISRDIAFWYTSDDLEEILNIFKLESGDLSEGEPFMFDKFTKDGRNSYAFRLVFQSNERTLLTEEVDKIIDQIMLKLKLIPGIETR